MFRAFAALLIPTAAILGWLALNRPEPRADFIVASDEIRTIDPARVSWLDEIEVTRCLFEGLTRRDIRSGAPLPGAAAHWVVSSDQLTYTFVLRPTARWSNGASLRADDFRFAWLRVLDPAVEAQYASMLWCIAGAREYYQSRLNRDAADDAAAESLGIAALDERTLQVRLAAPTPYFLELTAFPTLAPVYPPLIEQYTPREGGPPRDAKHAWTRPGKLISNGPFVLERWDFKRRLRLRLNPRYDEPAPRERPRVDEIEFQIIPSPGAALAAYLTGTVDLVRGLEPETTQALLTSSGALREELHVGDRFATYFFRVNCRRLPFDKPALRQAWALAIDKPAICEKVLGLGERPADTYVPTSAIALMKRPTGRADESFAVYRAPTGLGAGLTHEQRVRLAREKLAALEATVFERPVEIAYPPEPPQHRRIAEAIQQMWETDLGIRVSLRVLERKSLNARIASLDYDLARSDWYGDYLDPSTFLEMFTSQSGQNRTGWSSARYDELIRTAAQDSDPQRRFDLYAQAEAILVRDELPIIPLFFKRGNYLLRPGFSGIDDNPLDVLAIENVARAAGPKSQ